MGRIHTYAVIPARDEEDYIGSVINDIAPLVKGICIVNDDSADRTANIARETLHSHPQLQIADLVDGSGKGPGAAVRRGIQRLRERGVSDEHC